jgi:NAD(P)-dependent dehydrogenase (short-subunit alcohol dehydrogenase family)
MSKGWAVILGASSGFGAACGLALAKSGYNIFGVHLDLKTTMPKVKEVVQRIEATGRQAVFLNMNAADEIKRTLALEKLQARMAEATPPERVHVLLHSLAFGTLLPFIAPAGQAVTKPQMDMTLDVMANSLVYWVQDLVTRGMLAPDSRIFAMTSAGSHRVVPHYGAVSAAKAALESHVRQLAYELAPQAIRVNALQAGLTDTPALRKIPGNEKMVDWALQVNPSRRLTSVEDVAGTLVSLCGPGTSWVTGTIIRVDGGEDISG